MMNVTENRLYETMLSMGLKPEPQYKISNMKVDFAFPKEKLVIEVDGPYKRNAGGMKTLFERRRICEKEGWRVENFTAEEVYEKPEKVAWRIFHILKKENFKNKTLDEFSKNYVPKGQTTLPKKEKKQEEVRISKGKEKRKKKGKKILLILITLLLIYVSWGVYENSKSPRLTKEEIGFANYVYTSNKLTTEDAEKFLEIDKHVDKICSLHCKNQFFNQASLGLSGNDLEIQCFCSDSESSQINLHYYGIDPKTGEILSTW